MISGSTSTGQVWRISADKSIDLRRPAIVAILNLTPDSFSDGGELVGPGEALRAAIEAIQLGADGLDVGGESTRPGAQRVSAEEQIQRVTPTLRLLRRTLGDKLPITIDTTLSQVARAAFDAGADAVNDVSAGMESPEMLSMLGREGRGIVLMHRLVAPEQDVYSTQYKSEPTYGKKGSNEAVGVRGVVGAVKHFLQERIRTALDAGIRREGIVIDPGLGFGKSVQQNLELIDGTKELCKLGYPVMSGLSRKSFVGAWAGLEAGVEPRSRAQASAMLSVRHYEAGAKIFRVHAADVGIHRVLLDTADRKTRT